MAVGKPDKSQELIVWRKCNGLAYFFDPAFLPAVDCSLCLFSANVIVSRQKTKVAKYLTLDIRRHPNQTVSRHNLESKTYLNLKKKWKIQWQLVLNYIFFKQISIFSRNSSIVDKLYIKRKANNFSLIFFLLERFVF